MHEGHRKRMIDKLLSDPNVLSDHELLEILLFYAIPRKNVNETAHNLLDALGNLQNVFSCDHESLADIDGIGDRSAALFVLINQINERIANSTKKQEPLINYEITRKYLIDSFRPLNEENFLALYLDKRRNVQFRRKFSSHSPHMVSIDLSELQKGLARQKPYSVIIAHNHLSGSPLPSVFDDETTEKLTAILRLNNVILDDHIIVAGNQTYSYRQAGKLEKYKRNLSLYLSDKK